MILVTGASGLTGSFVVAELSRRGLAVRALCRSSSSAPPGAEVAVGNLGDLESLARAMRGTTGVVHTACTYTASAIDIAAMTALLAAREAGAFVFVSTLDVYGLVDGDVTEDTPTTETFNDYSRGKVICERMLEDAALRTGRRDHVALRAPYIWGPHATARRRLVTRRLRDGLPIVLPGVAAAEWSRYADAWVDVRDFATIIAESLARPAGQPLNVATGHVSPHDLYADLIRLTRSASVIVHKPYDAITDDELPSKQLFARTWQFREDRLARVLAPIERRPLATTLRETVATPE